jgi:phosphatidate phosphatase PAH1
VVEQPDGSFQSTPFHVRFGKWAVFNIDDKVSSSELLNILKSTFFSLSTFRSIMKELKALK